MEYVHHCYSSEGSGFVVEASSFEKRLTLRRHSWTRLLFVCSLFYMIGTRSNSIDNMYWTNKQTDSHNVIFTHQLLCNNRRLYQYKHSNKSVNITNY